jgi:putative ABC transport system ATP-binding protein
MSVLQARSLKKAYRVGSQSLDILKGIDFELKSGESVAIMGPSGSGKTTFLQILGVMLRPDQGALSIAEHDVLTLGDDELSKFRRRKLGFIFQKFNLLGTMTALENVAWPLLIDGGAHRENTTRAQQLLGKVGLGERAGHYPHQLSGGEQQRVAIARALVARPAIVFADEPTGALDSKNGIQILELIRETVRSENGSLIMVTHDPEAAKYCDRLFNLKDGQQC